MTRRPTNAAATLVRLFFSIHDYCLDLCLIKYQPTGCVDPDEDRRSRFVRSLRLASQIFNSPGSNEYGLPDNDDSMPRHIPQLSTEHARDIQEEVEFWAAPRLADKDTLLCNGSVEKGWFWGVGEAES